MMDAQVASCFPSISQPSASSTLPKSETDGVIVVAPHASTAPPPTTVSSASAPRPHSSTLPLCPRCTGGSCLFAVGFIEPWCYFCQQRSKDVWMSTSLADLSKATDDEIASKLVVLPRTLDAAYISVIQSRKPYHLACWDGSLPRNVWSRLHTLVFFRSGQISDVSLLSGSNRASLSQLSSLTVVADDLSATEVSCICSLRSLRSLSIKSTSVTDIVAKQIGSMKQLLDLHVSTCREITDVGIAHLSGLVELRALNLNWCHQLTDVGIAHLRGMAHLQSLNLRHCKNITDAGFAHIGSLTELQTLNLSGCGDNITNAVRST